jgi:uncharacterized protein involved in exopolysaccharide biosynthesis/Mrp family chromosome partitioning ATPase
MRHTSGPEDLQIADYTGLLRRRWWLIVAVTVIGTLGGIGYLKAAHKVYTATASVYVTATAGTVNQVANGRTSGTVNLDTEAQVVQSVTVAQAAARLMHATGTIQQLISRVSVAVPANTQVLSISCQGSPAAAAATCARSFAQAYLAYTSASTAAAVNAQISTLQSKISTLQSNAAKLSIEIASLPANSAQRAAANEQLNSDHSQLSWLNTQVAQLTAELANPSGGTVISDAVPPQSPSSPRALLVIPSGALAGLLLGLVLAFVVDRGNRRIRGPRDVSRLDVPVLMSLPRRPGPELAIAAPRSRAGREFSELAHVLAGSLGAGNHVVVVSGASAGRGAALVAANLAVALSRSQPDVTLVCADREGSVIPGMVGLPPAPGLADLLAGEAPNGNAGPRPAAAPRLRVITPGTPQVAAVDLQQDAVDQLLAELRRAARWVVVEAPAVRSGPDVYTLAHAADAVLLVAEVPRTRSNQLLDAVRHLENTGAAVLGAVLLRPPKGPVSRALAGRDAGLQGRQVPAVTSNGDGNGDGPAGRSASGGAPASVPRS